MSGDYTAERFAAVLDEHGDTMVLDREGEATTITLKGKRIPGTTVAIGGSAKQEQFDVKIAPTAILASTWTLKEPRRTDGILVDGKKRAVLEATPYKDSGVLCGYFLKVAG
ncbi:hypothetical protein [Reyranella sp.]|uniref:hypothetical protein n=1 Tax=Reyranella sp. TaxID=1929291 RepID=UPI00272F7725|nr:hypothetical protein [Reyranella sp.]MDP2377782.1 hypothetical protein [Reyranella sp.]